MDDNQITFKITLELDGQWATNLSEDELLDYIRHRMNSSLGFRGQIKKFNVVKQQAKTGN